MTTLYKQRIFCTTDSKWEYVWTETGTLITNCPTDTGHSVNSLSVSIIEEFVKNEVRLETERIPTGVVRTNGKYQLISEAFDCPGNTTTSSTISFEVPISVIAGYMFTDTSMQGDIVKIEVGRGTVVGITTADVYAGVTGIHVNSTVTANVIPRYQISITDGVTASEYLNVRYSDAVNGIIEVSEPFPGATGATGPEYYAGSYVTLSTIFANVELGPAGKYEIGSNTADTAYVAPNTKITYNYTNKSNSLKRPSFLMNIYH